MSADLRFRLALATDTDAVMGLLEGATTWLADRGSDQWQRMEHRRIGVDRDIGWGTLFLVMDGDTAVGTITVDELADADFWRRSDRVRTALYVHRMAVARSRSGEGIGSVMLNWAGRRAVRQSRSRLRLDAWRTNHDLHKYYEKQGFTRLRIEPVSGRGSGALFERPAMLQVGRGARAVPQRISGFGRRAHASSRR